MSVSEARKIDANFNITQFEHIPRDISSIRQELGDGGPISGDCFAVRQEKVNFRNNRIKRMRRINDVWPREQIAYGLVKYFEQAMTSGKSQRILAQIDETISTAPSADAKAPLFSQKARLLAKIGDSEGSENAMKSFSLRQVKPIQSMIVLKWIEGETGQTFLNSGLAAMAYSKGELSVAEYHYRKSIKSARDIQTYHRNANIHELRSALIMILIQQGRLTEAEAEARTAIKHLGIGAAALRMNKENYQTSYYSGINAGPVTMLASVFLEQGRLDDAAYLARIAVNMYEVGCSEPESLGLNRAREIYIRVLAQQGEWSDVLKQVKTARSALISYPALFEKQFGSSLDYAEAEIYAGNITLGHELLDRKKQSITSEQANKAGKTYELSVIKGLRALAYSKEGDSIKAVELFSATLPQLINSPPVGSSANLEGRRQRVLSGYSSQLKEFIDKGQLQVQSLDISDELLKIANSTKNNDVQNSLITSRIRAASGNKELSDLIRHQQDLEEEAASISEILIQLRFSEEYVKGNLNSEKFSGRLLEIRSASQVLKQEILTKFPKYAELMHPKPLSTSEISKYLKSGQALIVYHLENDYTYIWSIKKTGGLTFNISKIGSDEISEKVALLRQSVDPQSLDSINDIPDYDTKLAHELYKKLLKPVIQSLTNVNELLIVPDGALGHLPFAMLVTNDDPERDSEEVLFSKYRGVDWLTKQYSISQLPSINTLKDISYFDQTQAVDTRKAFVGFGDPIFSFKQQRDDKINIAQARSNKKGILRGLLPISKEIDKKTTSVIDISILPRLPDTRDEILSIARTLNANLKEDVFVGENASEDMLLKTDLYKL